MIPTLFDYLPSSAGQLFKLGAEEPKKEPIKSPYLHAAKTVGKGLLGTAVGTMAGAGAAELLNRGVKKVTGKGLDLPLLIPAVSVLGAGAGLAYQRYKAKELEELQRAYESHRDQHKGRATGQ